MPRLCLGNKSSRSARGKNACWKHHCAKLSSSHPTPRKRERPYRGSGRAGGRVLNIPSMGTHWHGPKEHPGTGTHWHHPTSHPIPSQPGPSRPGPAPPAAGAVAFPARPGRVPVSQRAPRAPFRPVPGHGECGPGLVPENPPSSAPQTPRRGGNAARPGTGGGPARGAPTGISRRVCVRREWGPSPLRAGEACGTLGTGIRPVLLPLGGAGLARCVHSGTGWAALLGRLPEGGGLGLPGGRC